MYNGVHAFFLKAMKKILTYTLSTVGVLVVAAVAVPFFFKDTIQQQLNQAIAKQVKANVYYEDVSLSFFKNFPSLTVSLDNFGVVGKAPFAQDTLVQATAFDLALNLGSVIKGSPEIAHVNLDKPKILVKVLKDGQANYDIMVEKDTTQTTETPTEAGMKMKVEHWQITDGQVVYRNLQDNSLVELLGINHEGSGDISSATFDLSTETVIDEANVFFQGQDYFKKRKLTLNSVIDVNQIDKTYSFAKTLVGVNDFTLNLDGKIAQIKDDFQIDLTFNTPESAFKNLISLIPSLYQNQFNDLDAKGEIAFDGAVKGLYSATTIPTFNFNLAVTQGAFQYPSLPSGVKDVNIVLNVNNPTAQLENTQINLKRFDLMLGNNPVKADALIKGLKRSEVLANLVAKFDLQEMAALFPMDGLQLKGAFGIDLHAKGVYDSVTHQFPVTKAQLLLNKGFIKSKEFPAPIENINVNATLLNTNGSLAATELKINQGSMMLEQETFTAQGVISNFENYAWDIVAKGKVDLTKITKIYPLENMTVKGKINADVHAKGKMADVLAKRYTSLSNNGTAQINDFEFVSKEYPQGVKITQANLTFTPNEIKVSDSKGFLGSSDFQATGSFSNYMGYAMSNDKLKGNIVVSSQNFNVNEWMTSQPQPAGQTPVMGVVEVPKNLAITMQAKAGQILYDKMKMQNATGTLNIADGTMKLQNTAFDALGGHFSTTGSYNTTDIAHPTFSFGLNLEKISLTEAYQNLTVVKTLMPLAQYMVGEVSSQFKLDGELGQDMMPKLQSLNADGLVKLLKASLEQNPLVGKLVETTKLSQLKNLQLNDLLMQMQINNGIVSLKPFTIKWNDYNLTIQGKHGLEGSMDYKLGFDVPSGKAGQTFSSAFAQWTGKSLQNTPRVKFDLGMGGSLKTPTFKFSGSSTAQSLKDAVASELNAQLGGAKAQATEQLGNLKQEAEAKLQAEKEKLLQNAQKEQEALQAKAKATADSLKKVAEDKAKKLVETQKNNLLNGLFKKAKPAKKDSTR